MANPTTNFGWVMPAATDLVTDLPADFNTFGQAVDTSMADLKGGTTGQILSKATNTDMDFTWITNDQGDITAVTAGTGISGGGTSGAVTITNSMATEITAKGDLIVGTGSATFDNLAAGANGETLVADSSTSTGLRYTGNYAAGKNAIINGDFFINQRAFTSNTTTDLYNFDRWQTVNADGTVTCTPQTFTPGTAPVAGYEGKNFLRIVTTGQTLTSARANFAQKIESVRTFAGQTVTVSFWAKANSGTPAISVEAFQNFGSGGSPSASVSGSVASGTVAKKTISTSWARYSATLTIPSISGKTLGTTNDGFLSMNFWISGGSDFNTRTDSLGIQSNTFDIWGVQVESGSVATAFQTATGTLQGELAAAMRYYQVLNRTAVSFIGMASSTTAMAAPVQLVQPMRTAPTVTMGTAGKNAGEASFLTSVAGYPTTVGTHAANNITAIGFELAGSGYSASYTAGNATNFYSNGNQNVYTASAEL